MGSMCVHYTSPLITPLNSISGERVTSRPLKGGFDSSPWVDTYKGDKEVQHLAVQCMLNFLKTVHVFSIGPGVQCHHKQVQAQQ